MRMAQSLREGLVLGFGNPLLDISGVADNEFLDKYGLLPNNAILAEEKHKPMYSELVEKYNVEYIAGGATQNTLRVAQFVLRKPNVTVFMGSVGKDSNSEILEKKAREDGVNVRYQYTNDEPTGTCAVIVTDGGKNRSLCANLAAANLFKPSHIEIPENKAYLENAEYYYISGFFLTVSPETILRVAEQASSADRLFMMNLSAPFLCQFFKEPMMKAFPYIDVLFGNETEAATFAKEQNFSDTSNMKKIALQIACLTKLNKKRQRLVVITQGADPVLVAQDGKVTEYPVQKLPSSDIVDTNGAGDAFVGGFLAQLVLHRPIETCIKCGIWAATHIIQRSGCTFDSDVKYEE